MRVQEEVLTVLSALEIDPKGKSLRIVEQLDRKLYLKVDKVLKAAGGKWNRKAQAHLFDVDPTETIDQICLTGEVTTHRDVGHFETPRPLAREMVALVGVSPGDRVLEPSAGGGRLVRAIIEAGGQACCCERDPARRETLITGRVDELNTRIVDNEGRHKVFPWCEDFMELELRRTPMRGVGYDSVVMNPPFLKVGKGDHLDHVRHAFEMLRVGGKLVSVLPGGVTFRQDRRYREFREWVEELDGEIKPLPDDSFKVSGTNVRTVLLTLQKAA